MRFDKYSTLIIALICCNITGVYGGAFMLSRIIAVAASFYVFRNRLDLQINSYLKLFFVVWLLISVFSLLWTPDISNGIKYCIYNYCSILLFMLLVLLYKKSNYSNTSLIKGWIFLFMLTIPIALYEFSSGSHLGVSVTNDGTIMTETGQKELRTSASVTFGNLNTYVVVCVYCLPFILASILYKKNIRSIAFIALVFEIIVILINASRGGIICLSLSFMLFIYYAFKEGRINKFILLLGIGVLCILLAYYADILFAQIMGRLIDSSTTEDTSRIDIYNNCLTVLYSSFFLGSGIGGLEKALLTIAPAEIPAPHNMWLEFLSQYGLLSFIFFFVFIFKLLRKLYLGNDLNHFISVVFIVICFPLFIINSAYLTFPLFWLFIASIYCLSLNNQKKCLT